MMRHDKFCTVKNVKKNKICNEKQLCKHDGVVRALGSINKTQGAYKENNFKFFYTWLNTKLALIQLAIGWLLFK